MPQVTMRQMLEAGVHFGHQRQAQGVHVGEVPVKAGGHDTCRLGHFAQADAAETAAALHELAGSVEQGLAGLKLLFGARQHGR